MAGNSGNAYFISDESIGRALTAHGRYASLSLRRYRQAAMAGAVAGLPLSQSRAAR
jgi:hypothetical protein